MNNTIEKNNYSTTKAHRNMTACKIAYMQSADGRPMMAINTASRIDSLPAN